MANLELEIGYLPSVGEGRGGAKVYGFGTREALTLGPLYPDRCAMAERDGFDAVIIHCFIDPENRNVTKKAAKSTKDIRSL
jgi:hypothetical protein